MTMTYDPSHPGYGIRIRARRARALALETVTVNGRTGVRTGRDIGGSIAVMSPSELPPVHSSGAFHAYPYGMPRPSDFHAARDTARVNV